MARPRGGQMKRGARRDQGKPSLELVEEALHLVRSAPAATLAMYYLGALPFVLGALWFWADMSRSPFAEQHLEGASLGLAALFLWMKFWQGLYARALRAAMGKGQEPLGRGAVWRMVVTHAALQPTGLFLLPLALVPVLPFPLVFAFYQNLAALADGEAAGLGVVVKRAARQALLWRRQNSMLLAVLWGFALLVFLNWSTFCFLLPGLLKMLFGIESIFTRSNLSMLNTTFFAAMAGLTYLCVDPILKAAYSLRCFYGESVQSGEDLKAELRQLVPAGAAQVAMCALLVLAGPASGAAPLTASATAGSANAPAAALRLPAPDTPPRGPTDRPTGLLSAPELDRKIREVVHQPKYTWRMPRERAAEPEARRSGLIGRFFERMGELLGRWARAVGDSLVKLLRRLFSGRSQTPSGGSGYGWMVLLQLLLYALIAAAVVGLGFLLYRVWRSRHPRPGAIAGEPVQPALDLADENLGAGDLPVDGWTKLARELLARGELRLALRAFYLASLAHLSERNLISLARFKSNRDYERELRRRGHSFPELLEVFGENVSVFERAWYGMHEVSDELVARFADNVERMRSGEC